MNFLHQGFQKLRHYRQTDARTDVTDNITMPHARVKINKSTLLNTSKQVKIRRKKTIFQREVTYMYNVCLVGLNGTTDLSVRQWRILTKLKGAETFCPYLVTRQHRKLSVPGTGTDADTDLSIKIDRWSIPRPDETDACAYTPCPLNQEIFLRLVGVLVPASNVSLRKIASLKTLHKMSRKRL